MVNSLFTNNFFVCIKSFLAFVEAKNLWERNTTN